MNGLEFWDLALLTIGVIGTGAVAGVLSGLLGVGGGIVVVPVLFWVLDVLGFPPELGMQVAVATSLTTVSLTALSSAKAHHRRGSVDMTLVWRWAPWMALGALMGGLVAGLISGQILLLVFGSIGLLVAWNFARPKTLILADALPETLGAQPAMATGMGTISAMMGIGAGTLGVPLMTAFSVPVHRAVGTAATLGLVIGAPAALAMIVTGLNTPGRPPLSLGYVNMPAAALILPLSMICAPLGARLAHAMEPIWIKRAFAVFLCITAGKMLWTALT
jgi:uncharacterized protein